MVTNPIYLSIVCPQYVHVHLFVMYVCVFVHMYIHVCMGVCTVYIFVCFCGYVCAPLHVKMPFFCMECLSWLSAMQEVPHWHRIWHWIDTRILLTSDVTFEYTGVRTRGILGVSPVISIKGITFPCLAKGIWRDEISYSLFLTEEGGPEQCVPGFATRSMHSLAFKFEILYLKKCILSCVCVCVCWCVCVCARVSKDGDWSVDAKPVHKCLFLSVKANCLSGVHKYRDSRRGLIFWRQKPLRKSMWGKWHNRVWMHTLCFLFWVSVCIEHINYSLSYT